MQRRDELTKSPPKDPWLIRVLALFMSPLYILTITTSTYAEIPTAARIVEIKGLSELGVRRGSRYNPADQNTVLKRHTDTLILPASGRSKAGLRFFSRFGADLGLFVRAITRNDLQTLYYFPCTFLGSEFIMEWANIGRKRGCDRGIRVQRLGNRRKKGVDTKTLDLQLEKQLSTGDPRSQFRYHCVALNNAGQGWFSVEEPNYPCRSPLEECLAKTPTEDCTIATLDRWRTRDPEITLILACANNQVFEAQGTGTQLEEQIRQIWEQAKAQKATWCGLHTLSSEDVLIIPKDERVLVRTRDTGSATSVEVLAGSATVKTGNNVKGIEVRTGQRYLYTNTDTPGTIEPFDANQELNSPEIQEFIVAAKPPQIPPGNPADAEYVIAALADGNYTFCNNPQNPPGTYPYPSETVCFSFQKIGNRAIGSYFYAGSDPAIDCIEGEINANTVTGFALDLPDEGPYRNIPKISEKEFLWGHLGRLKLSQGKIVYTETFLGNTRIDWFQFRTAQLDINGFYRYSHRQSDLVYSKAPRPIGCSLSNYRSYLEERKRWQQQNSF